MPVAAVVDRLDHARRRGPAQHRAGQRGGLRRGQPRQRQLLGEPLVEQPRAPLPQVGARVQLVAAVGGRQQRGAPADTRREVRQHVEAELVRPVQVLQHQQQAVAVGGRQPEQRVGQVLDQQTALPVLVAFGRPGAQPARKRGAELAEPLVGRVPQVAAEVEQHAAGGLGVAGERRRPRHQKAPPLRPAGDRSEQAGLADARLPGDQQQAAGARRGLGEPPVGQRQELVAADQDRRLHDLTTADADHPLRRRRASISGVAPAQARASARCRVDPCGPS
jgi:hypothetical protein